MTVNPTDYDLVQDERILVVEDVLTSAAEPPTGAEFSYPVVDRAVSDEMWQWITMGVGSGMIDIGGEPYNLVNLSNANNTGQLAVSNVSGTANAIVRGFFHQLSEAMTVNLPMPSSGTTTYRICLTYNPLNSRNPEGPVSVQVYTTEPPTTSGRIHVILWTVVRQANQLLTDATITSHRVRIAPTLLVSTRERLPDPSLMPWGTMCMNHQYGEWFMAAGATAANGGPTRWVNLSTPIISPISLYSFRVEMNASRPPRSHLVNGVVHLSGGFRRSTGDLFTVDSEGWYMGTITASHRPSAQQDMAATNFMPNPSMVRIRVEQNGQITAFPGGTTGAIILDGCSYTLE